MKKTFGSNSSRVQRINVIPMMNLVAVLIPFLIATASFTRISGIDVNLPAGTDGTGSPAVKNDALLLTVLISDRGLTVSGRGMIMPTLPVQNGIYPYQLLRAELVRVQSAYKSNKEVIISAEAEINYEVIVAVMDVCREAGMPGISIAALE